MLVRWQARRRRVTGADTGSRQEEGLIRVDVGYAGSRSM